MELKRYTEISQASSVDALKTQLVRFAADMDFGIVNAMMVYESSSLVSPPKIVTVGNDPESFAAESREHDRVRRDPVTKRLRTLSIPFIYDQATYVDEGAADLWDAQAPHGYRTGIAVALHLPNNRHFVMGLDREKALPTDDSKLSRMLADLQLLAVHAQASASMLLVATDGCEAAASSLTPRETEVLKWTADGKSAWAVGQILGISGHTVNYHLRSIFSKLGVSSKPQAVLKATRLRLL